MRTLTVPILPEGVLVDVLIGLDAGKVQQLRQAGQPVPGPISATAIIDCGAQVTCLETRLLAQMVAGCLAPVRHGFVNVPAAGGVLPTSEYAVSLTIVPSSSKLREQLVFRRLPIMEIALEKLGYQMLIGRDVLDQCLHVYNGPERSFTLAY